MSATITERGAGRIERALASCPDVETLAHALFAGIGAIVPFDFACLATLDPANGVITGAIKSRPLPVGDEEFSALEYGGKDVNAFAELAARPVPVGALSLDTGGDPAASRRFREFMAPRFGFTDELRVACRSRGATWAALALYRGPGESAFDADEARVVGAVHEAVAEAVQRVLLADPASSTEPAAAAVLVLDGSGRVTASGAGADEVVAELGGTDGGSAPANLLAVAAKARSDAAPTTSRVRGRSGDWYAIRALPLAADGAVVLTVDAAPQAAVAQIALAARGLTARETEVVRLVLQGGSTRSIAAALHLSPHTVQDHLKAVFDKVGVRSRRELVARFVD